jgi:hypothetical protein
MVRRARFFVDQIIEQLAARRLIIRAGMHRGEIGRERRDVVVILARVICERFPAELPASPGEIERMSEKMLRGDLAVDGVEMCVHMVCLRMQLFLTANSVTRELFFDPCSRRPVGDAGLRQALLSRFAQRSGYRINSRPGCV